MTHLLTVLNEKLNKKGIIPHLTQSTTNPSKPHGTNMQ